jgi:hypothetical protein
MELKDSEKFLKQVKKARQELKYNRANFWTKNKDNFRNNIKTLCSYFPAPAGWNLNIIASHFLLDRGEGMPYDKDVWSFSDVVSGTEAQGKEIIVFFNRADLEFLSAPALLPIVIHEMVHVVQVSEDKVDYILSTFDDEVSRKYEGLADIEVKKYSDEFRKQNVMEKVLFCYDKEGWKGARKIADYLFKEAQDSFGGGYDQDMLKEEYDALLKAEEEKDIDLFVDYFIESFPKQDKLD